MVYYWPSYTLFKTVIFKKMPFNDISNILTTPKKTEKNGFVRKYVRNLPPEKRRYVLSNFEIRRGEIYDRLTKTVYSRTPDSIRHRMVEIQRETFRSSTISPLKLHQSNSQTLFSSLGSILDWNDNASSDDGEEDLECPPVVCSPRHRRKSACETIRNVSKSARSVLHETIKYLVTSVGLKKKSLRGRLDDANAYAKRVIREYSAVDYSNNNEVGYLDLEIGCSTDICSTRNSSSSSSSSSSNSSPVVTVVPLSLV